MPLYSRLPPPLRLRLEGLLQQFMAEKTFVGCGDLKVTLEMKLAVAAQACLLIVNRPGGVYEQLYAILLYPGAFRVPEEEHDEAGVVSVGESVLSGQAWETDRIVLSWDDVQAASDEPGAVYNVVLHEFAHYLDAEDGSANGAPPLRDRDSYRSWSQVMQSEYAALQAAAARGEQALLDPYGADDPAEFFAVATETFFGQPEAMKREHAALYEQLCSCYRLDPATWAPGSQACPAG